MEEIGLKNNCKSLIQYTHFHLEFCNRASKKFQQELHFPLIISNKKMLIAGTFCGVFRRQALDRGAMLLKCNKIVTGTEYIRRS